MLVDAKKKESEEYSKPQNTKAPKIDKVGIRR